MKRSELNRVIKDMELLIREHRFELPSFAKWTEEEWQNKGHNYDEIRDTKLGWDVTDFGMGDFKKVGLSLLTIRNGNQKKEGYEKAYAEKLLMLYEGQAVAMHFHWDKMEDIVNRGGNDVYITVYNGDKDGRRLNTDVNVMCDGLHKIVLAGTKVRLRPGESITITQYMYHDFIVPELGGSVLLGEISTCNDDENDNRFYDKSVGRFPTIDEDEPKYRLLCNEYPSVLEVKDVSQS